MSKIMELREKRTKLWSDTKAFLDSHQKDGVLCAEDNTTYERMENDVVVLGHEIERLERQAAIDREMAAPVNAPITQKPESGRPAEVKKGIASDAYRAAFWNQLRRISTPEIRNALEAGEESEGGYLVPDEYEQTLLQAMDDFNIVRQVAHKFRTIPDPTKSPSSPAKGKRVG